MNKEHFSREEAESKLEAYFRRSGYLRVPSRSRSKEGSRAYKKGWEVRLVAADEAELEEMRLLLECAGFRLARPYARSPHRWAQPVYGYEAVRRFCTFSNYKLDELDAAPTAPLVREDAEAQADT